jgi:predicted AAA+ superfamily ATPase
VNPSGRCYLFLDEIQNIPQWEKWVRGRSETEDVKMVVTGSSSRLLSREAGTKLTGRHISFEIFPLSFVEFLRFNELTAKSKEEYYLQKSTIRKLFTEYMHYGGFPEVVLRRDSEQKELLLKQYFEDILHRDVVSRYEIRDTMTLQNLGVFLMTNIGRLTSITNLKKNLNVSQDKVENYLSALMESYLLFRVPKFDFSMKKSIRARFKPYAVDTGLRNRVSFSFSGDTGWLAENIVLNHLRNRHEEIYYHANGGDIDFIVKEGMNVTRYIQVWFDDTAETTVPERELRSFEYPALSKVSAEYFLLTNDLDTSITVGEKNIRCLPIAMFLLDIK